MEKASAAQSCRYYYVDEAGDSTLFDRKGRVLIGQEGCSRFFMLGMLDIVNPSRVEYEMAALREKLLADPYFSGVPSLQPKAGKTAVALHAKDDLPEVRREMFSLLSKEEFRFFAVVRDKWKGLDYVRRRNQVDPDYRYHPNELYDYLVRRLFKDRLHKDDEYRIYFAKRGKSDRTEALANALDEARRQFAHKWGIVSQARVQIFPAASSRIAGLQAADYHL